MAGPIARVNATWNLMVRNVVVDDEVVTSATDEAALTYTLTHKGEAFGSGGLAWNAPKREEAWSAQIVLPSTPGVLVVTVTVTVGAAVGSLRTSLQVVA